MRINLFGQRNPTGFGVYFSNFSDALQDADLDAGTVVEYDQFNPHQVQEARDASQPEDINIWMAPSTDVATLRGRNVMTAMFEATRLPRHYVSFLKEGADLFLAPSRWAQDTLIANGFDPGAIEVVPGGVDSSTFQPAPPAAESASLIRKIGLFSKRRRTRFLAVAKFEERKGYRHLLEAFTREFGPRDDVELHIKGDFFVAADGKVPELKRFIESYKSDKIVLHHGLKSDAEMLALYRSADAFVFPSRAEGWGLPLIEAIACGVPAIATDYSGQSAYLERIEGRFLPIRYELVPIEDPEIIGAWRPEDGNLGVWAEPDIAHLGAQMRAVHEQADHWKGLAREASETIRHEFSWQRNAAALLDRLQARGWM